MTVATIEPKLVDELIAQLAACSDAALRGFSQSQHLRSSNDRSRVLGRISDAVSQGRVQPDKLEAFLKHSERVNALIGELTAYRDPALKGFARRMGLVAGGDRKELLDRIIGALAAERLPVEKLSDYLEWLGRMDKLLEQLADYPDAVLDDFAVERELAVGGRRQETINAIADALHSERTPAAELDQFLRGLPRRFLKELDAHGPVAIEGLATETGLVLPKGDAGALTEALDSGRITPTGLAWYLEDVRRMDDAVEELSKFQRCQPPTQEFCRLVGLSPRGVLAELYERIRVALYRRTLPLSRLLDFLDQKRENGHQHIWLFQLDPGQENYLDELRAPGYFQRRLAELGIEDCVNQPRHVERAEAPELAAILLRGPDELLMKWVETRCWLQDGRPHRQRAVVFFRIHLGTGTAELCIQWLEKDRTRRLRQASREYRDRIALLVELERFSPLLLEPTVRYLLTSRSFELQSWSVQQSGGEALKGMGGGPAFLAGLLLACQGFFAVHVDGRWRKSFRTRLDGRTDVLDIPWETDFDTLAQFLTEVRQQAPARTGIGPDPTPKALARREVLIKVRQLLEERGRRHLRLKAIDAQAKACGKTLADFLDAIETGLAGFEDLMSGSYRIRCPERDRPVMKDNTILEYESFAELPKKVTCKHGKKKKSHATQANGLLYFRDFEPPPPSWQKLRPLFYLVAIITMVCLSFGWVASRDLTLFTGGLLACGFVLALAALIVLMRSIVGVGRFYEAVGEVKRLLGPEDSLPVRAFVWVRGKLRARKTAKKKKGP